MTRYVISDFHLHHDTIIEKCGRPFSSVEEMNDTLITNWNNTVQEDDLIYFLGDMAFATRAQVTQDIIPQLTGNLVFVPGNHDDIKPSDAEFPVLESCVIQHGKYKFWCTHRPSETPDDWHHWVLHGHVHNNNLYQHPFLFPQQNRVNVSAEVVGYKPRSLDEITSLLNNRKKLRKHPQSS